MKTILKMLSLFLILFSTLVCSQSIKKTFGNDCYEKDDLHWYKVENGKKWKVVDNQIVIKKRHKLQLKDLNLSHYGLNGLKIIFDNNGTDYGIIETPKDLDLMELTQKIMDLNLFEIVEPNLIGELSGNISKIDTDPLFNQQWNMQKINMPSAWNLSKGF